MKLNPTPRRLLQLDALFAGRLARPNPGGMREPVFEDTHLPDQPQAPGLRGMSRSGHGRVAAELALLAGENHDYPPRQESDVLELRARR